MKIRNQKSEPRNKSEIRNKKSETFRISIFRVSNLFRISSLEFRIFATLVGAILLLGASRVYADETVLSTTGDTTRLTSNIGGLSLGYIRAGTGEVANLAWRPDFKIGPWGMGADLNYALGENKPDGYESVVLRYLKYDDGKKGMCYGIIDNLTWGHGLLIRNYSSRMAGPVLLNNNQLAYNGYVDMDSFVMRALGTKSSVYGVRVEERVNPMLTLGQTYITDTDGVIPVGTTEVQRVSAVGVDAAVPLPFNFTGFAEYANLIGHGGGLGVGLSWAMDMIVLNASFLAEYRLQDSKFVPGYFDADYETNPINLASAEATGNSKNGYLAQMGLSVLGLASLTTVYEWYNDSGAGSLSADLTARLPQDVDVTGYYKQPNFSNFRSISLEEGAVMGGSIAYPLNAFTRVIAHYKKVYNPTTAQVEESQYYELRLSL